MQSSPSLASSDRLKQLLPELFNPTLSSGKQFLRLALSPGLTVAIELTWVEESLQLPTQMVTPIPNMPPAVLGLMSTKGQVFWAVNLAEHLNLSIALKPSQYYEVVVIRTLAANEHAANEHAANEQMRGISEQQFLGLVIPKIRGPIRLSSDEITLPTAEVDANLAPYVTGQVIVNDEVVLLLNAEMVAATPSTIPT